MTTSISETSLYEALGGRPSLVAAVGDFFGRLLADPELSPFFPNGVSEKHRANLITLLGEALGGRERYRGPDLAAVHHPLAITDAQFERVAGHLAATPDGLGVPRGLADQVVGIVAGLRPAVVSA
jgi:hemoglobin